MSSSRAVRACGEEPDGGVAGLVVVLAACSGSSSSPATAPNVTTTQAQATSAVTSTSTAPPTTLAPPTTVDRLAEIEAIFADLEFRRLDALYRNDEEAFRSLFANEAYLKESLTSFGSLEFLRPPDESQLTINVTEVMADTETCLAAALSEDGTDFLGPDATAQIILVLTPLAGSWGFAFGGDGWLCDGPHPLES